MDHHLFSSVSFDDHDHSKADHDHSNADTAEAHIDNGCSNIQARVCTNNHARVWRRFSNNGANGSDNHARVWRSDSYHGACSRFGFGRGHSDHGACIGCGFTDSGAHGTDNHAGAYVYTSIRR